MTASCSFAGCSKPVLARSWCGTHYARWHRHGDTTVILTRGVARRPSHITRNVRWNFTPEHWQSWLESRFYRDAQTEKLAAGIAEMRALLEKPDEILPAKRRA